MDAEIRKYMSEIGKKGAAAKTPEQKSAAAKKGWETKKRIKNEILKNS